MKDTKTHAKNTAGRKAGTTLLPALLVIFLAVTGCDNPAGGGEPGPGNGLSLTVESGNASLSVRWSAGIPDPAVFAGSGESIPPATEGTVVIDGDSAVIRGLTNNTPYHVWVRGSDGALIKSGEKAVPVAPPLLAARYEADSVVYALEKNTLSKYEADALVYAGLMVFVDPDGTTALKIAGSADLYGLKITRDNGSWLFQESSVAPLIEAGAIANKAELSAAWGEALEAVMAGLLVSFDSNGADTPATPAEIPVANAGDAIGTLPEPPAKKGVLFDGWNTRQDGGGSSFTAQSVVFNSLTVYAQWKADPSVVKGISGVPTGGVTGVEIDLSAATVTPATAAGAAIVWRLTDPGSTGVSAIVGGKFTPAHAGTIYLAGSVADGLEPGKPYIQDFSIRITAAFVPVTGITGVPEELETGAEADLGSARVVPENATNQSVAWTLIDPGTTGLLNVSGGIFTPATAGTLIIQGRIPNGTAQGSAFTREFTIIVRNAFVPVENIEGVPSTGMADRPLNLGAANVTPENADNRTILWSILDPNPTGASSNPDGVITPARGGALKLKAAVADGLEAGVDYTKEFTLAIAKSANANLISISAGTATLSPSLNATRTEYDIFVDHDSASISLTVAAEDPDAALEKTVWDKDLEVGANPIVIGVTAEDGATTKTYTITVTRAPEAAGTYAYTSLADMSAALAELPANTPDSPYTVELSGVGFDEMGGTFQRPGSSTEYPDPLLELYKALQGKYVNLDLSGIPESGGAAVPDRTNALSLPAGVYAATLTAVTLPDWVTAIGNYAFYNFSFLRSINLPQGISRIGNYAFSDTALDSVLQTPESLVTLGDNSFRGCEQLAGVDFSASGDLTAIGSNAFRDCEKLASVAWPPDIETIGANSFSGAGFLTLVLPATLKRVDSNAFSNCAALLWVKWPATPAGALIAGNGFFTNCGSLARVEIPAGLRGLNHFSYCENLAMIITHWDSTSTAPQYITAVNTGSNDTYKVYVPAAMLDSWYTNPATGWANFGLDRIVSIDELEDTPDKWGAVNEQ
jgi:uncharacterized repeat protein (TIGR02543 family)